MATKIIRCCINCGSECESNDEVYCSRCKKGSQRTQAKSTRKDRLFTPFVALDIETSGIPGEGECSLLEVAALYGDYGATNSSSKPKLNFYLQHDSIAWQPEAKKVVGYLEGKIKQGGLPVLTLSEARIELDRFLSQCLELSGEWKNLLVARNLHSLVIPMLKKEDLYNKELIDHRSLDLNSAFYFSMGRPSTIAELLKKYNIEAPDHSCMSDALSIMSLMYEEVGRVTKQSTHNWY